MARSSGEEEPLFTARAPLATAEGGGGGRDNGGEPHQEGPGGARGCISVDKSKFATPPKRGEDGWNPKAVQQVHVSNVRQYLPAWSYKEHVIAHPNAAFPGNETWTAKAIGFAGLGITWAAYIGCSWLAVIAVGASACPLEGTPLWWSIACVAIILVLLVIEWEMFRYLVVFQALRTYPFENPVPGCSKICGPCGAPQYVRFEFWLMVNFPASIAAHWDMFNIAQSNIKGIQFTWCGELPDATLSSFFRLGLLDRIPTHAFFFVAWCAMLVQPLLALLLCVRLPGQWGQGTYRTTFHTLLKTDTNDSDAALALAQFSRMQLMGCRASAVAKALDNFPPDALLIQIQSHFWKFVIISLLARLLQLNAKMFLAALLKDCSGSRPVPELVGIAVTVALMFKDCFDTRAVTAALVENAKGSSKKREERGQDLQEDKVRKGELYKNILDAFLVLQVIAVSVSFWLYIWDVTDGVEATSAC